MTSVGERQARSYRSAGGFSLLEVVVGLVLLATLLVSLILATTRHNQMIKLAEDRQLAVFVADELMGTWHDSRDGIPLSASGTVPGRRDMFWRTSVVSNRAVFGNIVPVVRVEILRQQNSQSNNLPSRVPAQDGVSLVSIETLASRLQKPTPGVLQ